MSYLLFMDESGHDHRSAPFEVRGGICVHARNVWPLTQKIKGLEFFAFGDHLHKYKSLDKTNGPEIKGKKLLKVKKFTLARQGMQFGNEERQELSRRLLGKGVRGESPTRAELTAFAQASILFCDELLRILVEHQVTVFASRIPNGSERPTGKLDEVVRKDIFFLYDRFHRFLKSERETGLLIMDQSEKTLDRRYVRGLENLVRGHEIGKQFLQTIVPSPIFVDSEMSYLVQAADVILYILNWGYRVSRFAQAPTRGELVNLDHGRIRSMVDVRKGRDGGKIYTSYSVFDVNDPWSTRPKQPENGKEGNAFEVVFRAPRGRASTQDVSTIPGNVPP